MFIKFVSVFIFLIGAQSFAQSNGQITLEVNGQLLALVGAVEKYGYITKGRLKETVDIKFGVNTMVKVPANTAVNFLLDSNKKHYISLMSISSGDFPLQKWNVDGAELSLDCSSYGAEENYRDRQITFYANLQMNGRCLISEEAFVRTPQGEKVLLSKGAELSFNRNGKMTYASKVKKGVISVFDQDVKVRENYALNYNADGSLYYFYMKDAEFFVTKTDLSDATKFIQKEGERARPFLFNDKGLMDSGYVELESPMERTVRIFEQEHMLSLLSGHMGFTLDGNLNRFVLGENLEFILGEDVEIYFVRAVDRKILPKALSAGERFAVSMGERLFLTFDSDGAPRLHGFPIFSGGMVYFLSLTGTSPESLPRK